jgi:hypothetical protein
MFNLEFRDLLVTVPFKEWEDFGSMNKPEDLPQAEEITLRVKGR